MTHTPEPWYISGSSPVMVISNAATIAKCGGIRIGTQQSVQQEIEANAARIVACVNACAGVDTETLVAMANGEMTGSEIWELAKVKQQRDELLAALKKYGRHQRLCRVWETLMQTDPACDCGLDEAIAKAGGNYDTNSDAIKNCDRGGK